ncbi:MAG: LysE family transporter [Myxococcota bacterium]|nr:LysE family transporter [Myxococcota bacterium]
MPWLSSLLAGALLGLAGGLSPGPLTALVLGETLRGGLRSGLRVSLAPLVTDGPLIGLALLIGALPPLATQVISVGGALFLLHLAWGMWRAEPPEPSEPPPEGLLRRAIATNLLNPHPYLFWLAVGGPMLLETAAPVAFLVGFFGLLVGSKAALAVLAERARPWLGSSGYRWTLRALGVGLVVLAGELIWSLLAG